MLAVGVDASAQSAVPLEGSARDAARAAIVSVGIFDPLLIAPLQPEPQVVVDACGSDVNATFHGALRNGDDSYGSHLQKQTARRAASHMDALLAAKA
ncbi:MAG TPA: hypothetical protein VGH34_23850 [Vicinamibacterales bacterium]